LWNLDFKGLSATINGCIQDTRGKPLLNAGLIALRGSGWHSDFSGYQPITDVMFTILRVPAGMPLELFSGEQPAAFVALAIPSLAPGEIRNLACVVVTNPHVGTAFFLIPPVTLFTTSVGSFAGLYSGSYTGDETGTFAFTVDTFGDVMGAARSIK
jgi:hypothetical protein